MSTQLKSRKLVVTSGMPYANGKLHLGHMAGAFVPPDIFARYNRMVRGAENVLYVCGSDEHGAATELAALKAGKSVKEFARTINLQQKESLARYSISLDVFSGTSSEELATIHNKTIHDSLVAMLGHGYLFKKATHQWFDPSIGKFLQDRFVKGQCPNPKCTNLDAYSDECDVCGSHYDASELINPRSELSDATPELKETTHWWLDMWKSSPTLLDWIETKRKTWKKQLFGEVHQTLLPALRIAKSFEETYKPIKDALPKHNSAYGPQKTIVLTFGGKADFETAKQQLADAGIDFEVKDSWAYRSMTRDIGWGMPLPAEFGEEAKGKTLYVWPESLLAPLSFTQLALKNKGLPPESYKDYWCSPDADIKQFLGQDNVFFYTIMQGSMWVGTWQHRGGAGDLQFSDIHSSNHLLVNGQKMSKSKGNFYLADELILDKGYAADQIRYYLALLNLADKSSNFDFEAFDEKNKFLAGPMNACFEKPISACHSKFDSKVPDGRVLANIQDETQKILAKYEELMGKCEFSRILGLIENYARLINSLFNKHKPHDDRGDLTERTDALYSCFYVLKTLMIMLHPFVPDTMEKLRTSLDLPKDVFRAEELGTPIQAGHKIGALGSFFPGEAQAK